jgi:hypothetical protein
MAPNTRHAPPGTPHQGKAADTRPTGMLVGRQPCSCCGGHMTWACRQCGAVVYAPPIGPRLPCAARCCRGAVISNTSESSHRTRSIAAMTAGSSGSSPSTRRAWASSSSTPSWTCRLVGRFLARAMSEPRKPHAHHRIPHTRGVEIRQRRRAGHPVILHASRRRRVRRAIGCHTRDRVGRSRDG